MSSIIGGSNNKVTNTCSSIIGGQRSINTCGSISIGGSISTQGQAGYLTDWKDDMMKKYPNFTIKTEYDTFSFVPTNNIITDNKTNKEYKFTPNSISNIVEETEQFIQTLITTIRDEKITNIING
jgi:hypothetical protein